MLDMKKYEELELVEISLEELQDLSSEDAEIEREQELPSGLVVEVEEWIVEDISKITTSSGASHSAAMDSAFENCTVLSDTRLAYDKDRGQKPPTSGMIVGDRVALSILQRIASYGPLLEKVHVCSNIACKKESDVVLDLRRFLIKELPKDETLEEILSFNKENSIGAKVVRTDLGLAMIVPSLGKIPILLGTTKKDISHCYWRSLSDEALAILQNKNSATWEDRKGNKVFWRLLTGKQEQVLATFGTKDLAKLRTETIVQRIIKIETIDGKEITKEKDIRAWTSRWSARQSDRFLKHVMSFDAGIESGVFVTCPHCEEEQETELPMNTSFFSPAVGEKISGKM